jgi:hypothetical protein
LDESEKNVLNIPKLLEKYLGRGDKNEKRL